MDSAFCMRVFYYSYRKYLRHPRKLCGRKLHGADAAGRRQGLYLHAPLFHEPKVGDIVVIDVSQDSDMNFFDSFVEYLKNNTLTKQLFGKNAEADKCWIKRIVGVEGDVLKFQDGKFYRNGGRRGLY